MAAVALDQYLASILNSNTDDTNELKLKSGNKNFDLFTIYLENHNTGIHRYGKDVSTILYVVRGAVTVKSNEKTLLLKAGNVLLLIENCEYEIQNQTNDAVLTKLKFKPGFKYHVFFKKFACKDPQEYKVIKKIVNVLEKEHMLWLKNNQVTRPAQVMQNVVNGYLNDEIFVGGLIIAELTILLILSIRARRMVTSAGLNKTKFEGSALDNYIDTHFANITLTQAAKYFGFNPNYFSNMVKRKTGKSFVDHVDERRMQEARNLLAQPDISLKEIIARVGYSSKSFFYKKFNQYYQQTPATMREELFRQANINLK